jgi:hypothetical protein
MLLPPFARHPLTRGAVLVLAFLGPPVGQAQPSHSNSACRSPTAEAQLLRRETALLGRAHAAEHAQMRAEQCEAERGLRPIPGKGVVAEPADTLQQDEAVRKAADDLALGVQSASDRVTQQAAIAADQGLWSTPFRIPVMGITSVLLHTGKVLFWSYDPVDYQNPDNSGNGVAYLWDPATRQGESITPPENIWCSGQTILADGRVFIAGGNLRYPDPSVTNGTGGWMGTLTTYTFNPLDKSWTRQPNMRNGRWYPSTTKLGDNRVVIMGGMDETGTDTYNVSVEVFTPALAMNGVGSILAVGSHAPASWYPMMYTLPSGSMLEAGPSRYTTNQLDPATWNWTYLGMMRGDHFAFGNGIIYTDASAAPAKSVVMVAGGYYGGIALAGNEWLDASNPTTGWRAFPQWLLPRRNSNTVILPDGSLLTIGGNQASTNYGLPLVEAELYAKPATDASGAWQKVAPPTIQAAYHSTAILLPDATVLLSQDDMDSSGTDHKAQVYSPPYLFKGARPGIVNVPAKVGYGQSFDITVDRKGLTGAVLVAPGATTHANDMHQRAIKLPVQVRNKIITATVPNSRGTVPPGYYMLFVLDRNGVPSVARFVNVS